MPSPSTQPSKIPVLTRSRSKQTTRQINPSVKAPNRIISPQQSAVNRLSLSVPNRGQVSEIPTSRVTLVSDSQSSVDLFSQDDRPNQIAEVEVSLSSTSTSPPTDTQSPSPHRVCTPSPTSILAGLASTSQAISARTPQPRVFRVPIQNPPSPRPIPTTTPSLNLDNTFPSVDHDYVQPLMSVNFVERPLSSSPSLPSIDNIFETHISLISHIPFGCRDQVADLFSIFMDKVTHEPTFLNFHILLSIPKLVLFSPLRRGKNSNRQWKSVILERVRRFHMGDYCSLWEDATANQSKLTRSQRKSQNSSQSSNSNAKRAERFARLGQYSKAIQALDSLGVAEDTDATFDALKSKHPHRPPPTLPPQPCPEPPAFSPEAVQSAVRSFFTDTAPGPSGLKANFLKDALSAPNANKRQRFLLSLTRFVNLLNNANVPESFRPYLFSANCHPLLKKDGGIRPVGVMEVFARLTSKCNANALSSELAEIFSPLQLGVKVQGGCEAVLHAVNQIFHSPLQSHQKATLLVDWKNAFNEIDRTRMLEEVRSRLPKLSSWAECVYGGPSNRYFRGRRFSCHTGANQGDPTAGFVFGLGLLPTIERVSRELPNLLANSWIHDDGVISGKTEDVSAAVTILEDESPSLGLTLNKSKCLVWVGKHDIHNPDPLGCNIPRTDPDGFLLLGSPIGSPQFMASKLNARIDKIENTIIKISQLEDPQLQYCLTRSTHSIVKFIYTIRTCDPLSIQPSLQRFDSIQSSALESILGASLTSEAIQQAALPVSKGGLGLKKAASHCFAAYLSSTIQTSCIVDRILPNFPHRRQVQEVLDDFLATSGPISDSTENDLKSLHPSHFSQSKLSHIIDTNIQNNLLTKASQISDSRSLARLRSLTLEHSSDYLNVIPSHTSGLSMLPQSFRHAILYRLGLPIYPTPDPRCPACGSQMDSYGDHTIVCATENERICRHDSLRDLIFETATHAGLFPKKEVRSLVPDSQKRPGDVYIPTW